MRSAFILVINIFLSVFAYGQTHLKNKGKLIIGLEGGLRAGISNHFTPYLSFSSLGKAGSNDRVYFSPLWNVQGICKYELPKIPFRFGLQAGIQWNQNVNFGGTFYSDNEFKPIRIGFRTINMGVSVEYMFYQKNNHHIGALLNCNALYIPNHYPDFTYEKVPLYGDIVSKEGGDTLHYNLLINSVNTRYGLNFQMESGFIYEYNIANHWAISGKLYYQFGFFQMLSTSAVFVTTDISGYNGNTSFSTNKGDGLCLNVGINYKIPFYKNL